MTEFFNKKLPFKVVSSSIDSGYATQISSGYKPGIDIVNMHKDNYAELNEPSAQGPFTSQHVGGYKFRHTLLNTGSDNDYNRAEYFKINPTASSLRVYGPDFEDVHKPRQQIWSGAKSPVNIKNIKSTSRTNGNFEKNYQVIQTSGRGITNNLIVDGFIASGNLTTQFINGTSPYSIPDLSNNSKSIFVEKFNAPGGKEESSRGSLERTGEEMSPNNSLTSRNIKVRQPFYRQLTQHSPQFNSGSTYQLLPATGTVSAVTIHGINRNNTRRYVFNSSSIVAANMYDNFWIQHAVPSSDYSYSWITASSVSDHYNSLLSGGLIQFNFTSSLLSSVPINLESQTILGSLSSSQQSYSSWRQTQTNLHPVARKLRESNLISVQNEPKNIVQKNSLQVNSLRSGNSTNFKETPITNKYFPIQQRVVFVDDQNNEQSTLLKYTNRNLTAHFANDLLNERLNFENSGNLSNSDFYNYILQSIQNSNNSPIKEVIYIGFRENIYPRSLNTYLSGTRSRTEYITDQPGFSRDGYDRQLGTQRVFWRDNQEDRHRSANSAGGYINSLGYSSLEESGSDFTQNENGILFDNNLINHSASLKQNFTNLDKGINNSIILLENNSEERNLYTYTGSFTGDFYNNGNSSNKIYANIIKRGYTNNISGEFNNLFIDFYEQFIKNNKKQSIGAIYRNTSYKQMINSLSNDRENLSEIVSRTDDEEIFVNPKLKYVSFIGGGELNTGSLFDNSNNFSNQYFTTYITGSSERIQKIISRNNKIYFCGHFTVIGGVAADYVAVYDEITQKFSKIGKNPQIIDKPVGAMALYGNDIYVATNGTPYKSSPVVQSTASFFKYSSDTDSWSQIGEFIQSVFASSFRVYMTDIAVSGSDLYISGDFLRAKTTISSSISSPYITKYSIDTNKFSFLSASLANGPNRRISSIAVSGADIYVGGANTTPSSFCGRWSTINNDWYTLAGITAGGGAAPEDIGVQSVILSGNDIYFGGRISSPGNGAVRWSTIDNQFYTMSSGLGSQGPRTLIISGNDIYAGGAFTSSLGRVARWSTIDQQWYSVSGTFENTSRVQTLSLSNNKIYAGGTFGTTFGHLGKYTRQYSTIDQNWSLISDLNYDKFNENILSNNSNIIDVKFSTLDNGLLLNKNKNSNNDSIEDYYYSDIYSLCKDFSILSEFKISDHISEYINSGSNFNKINNNFLILDGAEKKFISADSADSSFNKQYFFEKYSFSDVFNKKSLESSYLNNLKQENISLNISAVKKLLPYNGFYPQERTVQIANLYSNYIENCLSGGIYSLNNINDYYYNIILSGNNLQLQSSSYNNEIFCFLYPFI